MPRFDACQVCGKTEKLFGFPLFVKSLLASLSIACVIRDTVGCYPKSLADFHVVFIFAVYPCLSARRWDAVHFPLG